MTTAKEDNTAPRGLTINEICELAGTSRASTERAIARLIERGLIQEVKEPTP